ncbi:MAG: FAD-dependent oxidoreductase [Burkholderiales bacterium]|nr:FAD-dependent oxidoreductase [Burkholderiales bacterium]
MDSSSVHDVIVIGAGAGGMTAASVAAAEGLSTLILEKAARVGGTTAVSGGMVWIPANPKMLAAGLADTIDDARRYLAHVVPPGFHHELREAFLARANEALAYLEARTAVVLKPVPFYPDYYPDAPGATPGGRVMEPVAFDARELEPHFGLLRPPLPEFTMLGGMMVDRADIPHFRRVLRSAASALRVARVVARHARDRLSFDRGAHLVLGNALAARLLKSVLALGVELRTSTRVAALVLDGGCVAGVTLADGSLIPARRGVVLAAGGFSGDPGFRARYLPPGTGPSSAACPDDSGDGLRLGLAAGGRIVEENTHNAYWTPVSRFTRGDGTPAVFPHTVTDRGKPGVIAVDGSGRRFTNEAVSYHEFVKAMFRARAIPAFLVCDRTAMWKYGLGAIKPFALSHGAHAASGYLRRAASIRALGETLGIDPAALEATVLRYNEDARAGVDREFAKGADAYGKYVGDPEHAPNPCVAPLARSPFYAVVLHPGDLGTTAGLRTNANAQVLDGAGEPIAGLYACGNDMSSIMNGAYPGPGTTLGPALTFGYIAGRHLASGA